VTAITIKFTSSDSICIYDNNQRQNGQNRFLKEDAYAHQGCINWII